MKRFRLPILGILLVAVGVIVGFSLRGSNQLAPLGSTGINGIRTQAVETFSAGLTQTFEVSSISSATASATYTITPALTGTMTPTPACHALRFVRDVTIPDNTSMLPAQVFTKSWLVENSGTCPWKTGYQVTLIGGLAMGGSPFKVLQDVGPGGRIQVSIKMVAPTNQTGTIEGTWKMSDDTGAAFGDFMSVIIGVGSPSGTPGTAVATPTR